MRPIIKGIGAASAPFVVETILMIIQVESDWLMKMVWSIDPMGDVTLAKVIRVISIGIGVLVTRRLYNRFSRLSVAAVYIVVMWFVLSWYELAFGGLVYGMYL